MWTWLARWFAGHPDGGAAAEAQRQADEARRHSRIQGRQVDRVVREQQAVGRETDRVAEEIARTMRPREI
jgi:hypothetical protein